MSYQRFDVVSHLPRALDGLRDIAEGLRWAAVPEGEGVFHDLDPATWREAGHRPTVLLARLHPATAERAAADPRFVKRVERLHAESKRARHVPWFARKKHPASARVAYFSMEFGLHESLPFYSGGLGVLAGDHLKSADDEGIPLVAVGLAYHEGRLEQHIADDGSQTERYPRQRFAELAMTPWAAKADGPPEEFTIPFAERPLHVRAWKVAVGKVPLYLLDTDFAANPPESRAITAQLYGGDPDMRIRQEILLGFGGVELLSRLGIEPAVFHLNEGHSAFLALERVRRLMMLGLTLAEAAEYVAATSVFTTHTPIPAGNDRFHPDLVERYLGHFRETLGLDREAFLAWGRENPADATEYFCMTVLALKLSRHANGVSALHGVVSRKMWSALWPGLPASEVPIDHVTNGIHVPTWTSADNAALFDRFLGPEWRHGAMAPDEWRAVEHVPEAEAWQVRQTGRQRLIDFLVHRRASAPVGRSGSRTLNPGALTIGFARRFVQYKRATLLLRDEKRLLRLLHDDARPIQFVFAGKAHPRDAAGKELIRALWRFAKRPETRGRFVVVEDYDMALARAMVQGVDVWLNNPRRPLEASGTSGMKAAANGALNLSVLDGWWDEACDGHNGWAIGDREEDEDAVRDEREARQLMDLLEHEVIPLFYERNEAGIPSGWVRRSLHAIASVAPQFHSGRMVHDYTEKFYLPAAAAGERLKADAFAAARGLAAFRARVDNDFHTVHAGEPQWDAKGPPQADERLRVTIPVACGAFAPEELRVEVVYGRERVDAPRPDPLLPSVAPLAPGQWTEALERVTVIRAHLMAAPLGDTGGMEGRGTDGITWFEADLPLERPGPHRLSVRVRPHHSDAPQLWPGAPVVWAK